MARSPKEDPKRVNQLTGRVAAAWRPQVASLGPDYVYSERFGSLWRGSGPAIIAGHSQRFGLDDDHLYSFEAIPGGYAFLINRQNPMDSYLVADLTSVPATKTARAAALCALLAVIFQDLKLTP